MAKKEISAADLAWALSHDEKVRDPNTLQDREMTQGEKTKAQRYLNRADKRDAFRNSEQEKAAREERNKRKAAERRAARTIEYNKSQARTSIAQIVGAK